VRWFLRRHTPPKLCYLLVPEAKTQIEELTAMPGLTATHNRDAKGKRYDNNFEKLKHYRFHGRRFEPVGKWMYDKESSKGGKLNFKSDSNKSAVYAFIVRQTVMYVGSTKIGKTMGLKRRLNVYLTENRPKAQGFRVRQLIIEALHPTKPVTAHPFLERRFNWAIDRRIAV
jgi:hypothetical protein